MTPSAPIHRFGDVRVRLAVELGRTDLPLKEVLSLSEGSVVSLDRLTDELLDVTANGREIAKAEVIAQDGRFALRIVSLAGEEDPVSPVASAGAADPAARTPEPPSVPDQPL
ncbi:MAG: FliM/FliN family flagellar motor switch protein [Pseudomonadota bacterium]